jgi:hypothetical protein
LLMATEYQPKNKISVTQLINELKHAFAAWQIQNNTITPRT